MWRYRAFTVCNMLVQSKKRLLYAAVPAVYVLSSTLRFMVNLRRVGGIKGLRPVYEGVRQKIVLPYGDVSCMHNLDSYDRSELSTVFVFVHGWGSSTDSAWFKVLKDFRHPYVAVDLPGHGESFRDGNFSIEMAASAVNDVLESLGVFRAHLVAHSMGGPVAVTAMRLRPSLYTGVSMLASSIFYKTPAIKVASFLAGKVMFKKSPFTLKRVMRDIRMSPEHKEAIVWAWLTRPSTKTLVSSAGKLRSFDARPWGVPKDKDVYFVIPERDAVVGKKIQKASAESMAAKVLLLDEGHHNFTITHPGAVLEHLDKVAERFSSEF